MASDTRITLSGAGSRKWAFAAVASGCAAAAGLAYLWWRAADKSAEDSAASNDEDNHNHTAGGRTASPDSSIRSTQPLTASLSPVQVYESLGAADATDPQALQAALTTALGHSAYDSLQVAYIQLGAFRRICALPLRADVPRRCAVLALQVVANYAAKERAHDDMMLSGLITFLIAAFWKAAADTNATAAPSTFDDGSDASGTTALIVSAARCVQNLAMSEAGVAIIRDSRLLDALLSTMSSRHAAQASTCCSALANIVTFDEGRGAVLSKVSLLSPTEPPASDAADFADYRATFGRVVAALLSAPADDIDATTLARLRGWAARFPAE